MIYNQLALFQLIRLKGLSERSLALKSALSRLTIRSLIAGKQDTRLSSLDAVAENLGYSLYLVPAHPDTQTDCSIQAIGYRILQEGEPSWKIHLMDFVDEFRRNFDARLILLPPPPGLSRKIEALMRSTVYFVCVEARIDPPQWSLKALRLDRPWFVSESEALKPMMILESPLPFRRNNIFVGENFLDRA